MLLYDKRTLRYLRCKRRYKTIGGGGFMSYLGGPEFNSDMLGIQFDNKDFDDVETTKEKEYIREKEAEMAKRKKKRGFLKFLHKK
jgi:hypothetical protein